MLLREQDALAVVGLRGLRQDRLEVDLGALVQHPGQPAIPSPPQPPVGRLGRAVVQAGDLEGPGIHQSVVPPTADEVRRPAAGHVVEQRAVEAGAHDVELPAGAEHPGVVREAATCSRTAAATSSADLAAVRSHRIRSMPPIGGWAWASWKPGRRSRHRRRRGRLRSGPARTSASLPSATILPALTARAVAPGCRQIAALRTTRSAATGAPGRRTRPHEALTSCHRVVHASMSAGLSKVAESR